MKTTLLFQGHVFYPTVKVLSCYWHSLLRIEENCEKGSRCRSYERQLHDSVTSPKRLHRRYSTASQLEARYTALQSGELLHIKTRRMVALGIQPSEAGWMS